MCPANLILLLITVLTAGKLKVKIKLSLCFLTEQHAMEAYWGSGSRTPRILDLGTRWRWVDSFTLRPLNPHGRRPWCPLDTRLCGSQSWSVQRGEETRTKTRTLDHPVRSPALYQWLLLTAGKQNKLWCSLLCNFLQPSVTSPFLGPKKFWTEMLTRIGYVTEWNEVNTAS
jgi:hypothetical protein